MKETKTNTGSITLHDISPAKSKATSFGTDGSIIIQRVTSVSYTEASWATSRVRWWKRQLKAKDPNATIDYTKVTQYEQAMMQFALYILSDRIVSLGVDNNNESLFKSVSLTGTDDGLHAKATTLSKQHWAKILGLRLDVNLWNYVLNVLKPVRADPFGNVIVTLALGSTTNWGTFLTTIFTYKDYYEQIMELVPSTLKTFELNDCDIMTKPEFCIVDDDAFISKLFAYQQMGNGVAYLFYCGSAPQLMLKAGNMDKAIYGILNKLPATAASAVPTLLIQAYNSGDITAKRVSFYITNRFATSLPYGDLWDAKVIYKLSYVVCSDAAMNNDITQWQIYQWSMGEMALNPQDTSDMDQLLEYLFDNGIPEYAPKSASLDPPVDKPERRFNNNGYRGNRRQSSDRKSGFKGPKGPGKDKGKDKPFSGRNTNAKDDKSKRGSKDTRPKQMKREEDAQ